MQRIALAWVVSSCMGGALLHADESGFKPIFDGQSLAGWDGNTQFWRVEDGAITGQTTAENPTKGNTFIVWRAGELDDFELRLEYRIVGGNSGVQYRSWEDEAEWGKWVIGGYQADLEAGDTWSGALYGERFRGILAARGEKTVIGADHKREAVGTVGDSAELQKGIRKEDWNEYVIRAEGYHFVHAINGNVTIDSTDKDTERRRRTGLLALQLHAGPPMKVQFRNIRLKRLALADRKKVVFVAGKKSHGYFAHEHNAGSILLANALNQSGLDVLATVYRNHLPENDSVFVEDKGKGVWPWPRDPTAFDNADALVFYNDGGGRHPVNQHLDEIDALMKKGVGLACLHYGVEVPKGASGDRFLDWIGGYFETHLSVNPHWTLQARRAELAADHPITRGVEPFTVDDEWYYNMRLASHQDGMTPILRGVPPAHTRERRFGPHSGNPHVRARRGMYETLAWCRERPDGGRGFGFTGGHRHENWGHDGFRKLVLNAILWVARGEVPTAGVPSQSLTREDLEANQDYPKR